MRIAIFGGTGRTGRHLVEQALAADHEVKALVRTLAKSTMQHPQLVIVEGDVLAPAKVAETVTGCEAVLCALGTGVFNPGTVLSVGTQNIVNAMKQYGAKRIVAISTLGIGDSWDQIPRIARLVAPLLRRHAAEKERQEQSIRESGLDWIIVRPFMLNEGDRTGQYVVGLRPSKVTAISRADLADFMLKQLTDDTFLKQCPAIVGN